jgi:hypothetical protein
MQTTFRIPGDVFAVINEDGTIAAVQFTPHAGSAGYNGPSAKYYDGPNEDLDVESVDGPFWRAMQAFLTTNDVEWTE